MPLQELGLLKMVQEGETEAPPPMQQFWTGLGPHNICKIRGFRYDSGGSGAPISSNMALRRRKEQSGETTVWKGEYIIKQHAFTFIQVTSWGQKAMTMILLCVRLFFKKWRDPEFLKLITLFLVDEINIVQFWDVELTHQNWPVWQHQTCNVKKKRKLWVTLFLPDVGWFMHLPHRLSVHGNQVSCLSRNC